MWWLWIWIYKKLVGLFVTFATRLPRTDGTSLSTTHHKREFSKMFQHIQFWLYAPGIQHLHFKRLLSMGFYSTSISEIIQQAYLQNLFLGCLCLPVFHGPPNVVKAAGAKRSVVIRTRACQAQPTRHCPWRGGVCDDQQGKPTHGKWHQS